ncbi:MAG: hypothetical protein COA81_04110 [Alphaproteobacteria bacterium]|nr:MAG: hypothetical protein COA81_04110 [Alphaproteobacteria bacterium]
MTLKIPKKLKELEKFLLSDAVSEDAMLLSELDGFMSGISICPALIMPSEWIPVIWAGEEPVFENEEQAQNIMSILMGYYNDTLHALDKGKYRPIYDRDNDGSPFWEIWLEGFFRAIHMRADEWLSFADNDNRDLQRSVFILTRLHEIVSAGDDFENMDIDAGLEEAAPDLIPESVMLLHNYRKQSALPPNSNDNHPNSKTEGSKTGSPKTGRNDPCPCGSGKKFKKCCLQ